MSKRETESENEREGKTEREGEIEREGTRGKENVCECAKHMGWFWFVGSIKL